MADSIFRSVDPVPQMTSPVSESDTTPGVSAPKEGTSKLVATYQDSVGHPFTAEHYEITNIWNADKGGFKAEVGTIESHIKDLVSSGELDNDTTAAAKYLESLEQKAEIDPAESTARKLVKLAAYVRMQQEIKNAMKWRENGNS